MTEVAVNGRSIEVERPTVAKTMRVLTLLKLVQQDAISDAWADYSREYALRNVMELDRLTAIAQFGDRFANVPEAEWERSEHKVKLPASPSLTEQFFHMAPIVYENAETVMLRFLGLLAMPNETVNHYVKTDDIWTRVDELVEEVIRPAPLDEVLELVLAAAEVMDRTVLERWRGMSERAGNALRSLGITTPTTATSNGHHERPSSPTSSTSPGATDGAPMRSGPSTSPTPSTSSTPASASTSSES